jgi:1,2-diacylglycerol 3-alpha-glucosyltransferase
VQRYLRLFLSGCDALVCPSQKARQAFQDFLPGLNAVVIGNGISRAIFQPEPLTRRQQAHIRRELGLGPGDQIVLYAGRIAREKRVVELLDALAPLLRAQRQAKALFVGSGPAERELAAAVERNGVASQVILSGTVEWQQMHRFYSVAHLFVTASLSEMHPMTLIEAALCGLPIVTRHDAAYEGLVREGYNGYLAASDRAIPVRILELLRDEAKRQSFSENARALSEQFTAGNHVRQIEALYQQLMGRRCA